MPSYLHDIEKLASFPLSAHHPQGTSGTLKLIFLTVECCIRITVTKYYNFYQLYCQAAAKFFVNSQRKSHPRVTLRWDRVTVFEADKLYRLRRKRCRPTFKLEDKELQAILRARLEEGWSPEQIKGRESLEVSVNTIYRAVKSGRLSFEARKHLRRRGKPYKRKTRQDGRGHIKDAVSIELRPEEVEQRLDIGNWEIDTVLGKPGTWGLVTVVDRKTRLLPPARTDVGSKDRGQDGDYGPGRSDPPARGDGVPQPDDRQRKGVCATQGSIRCLGGPCVLRLPPQPLGAWYE